MVHVQQDGVEAAVRLLGIQTAGIFDHREEVTLDQAAAGIRGQGGAQWDQPPLMPVDDLAECVDDDQGADTWVVQGGLGGVAEAEPAHHDVEFGVRQFRQAEPGQGDLARREEAGHQELVAELHFVHIVARCRVPSAPQTDVAHRRRAPVDLLETRAHLHLSDADDAYAWALLGELSAVHFPAVGRTGKWQSETCQASMMTGMMRGLRR